jgi:hypothetical protein
MIDSTIGQIWILRLTKRIFPISTPLGFFNFDTGQKDKDIALWIFFEMENGKIS